MTSHTQSNAAGFTLAELAIVIAILGIIAMVAVPKFADHVSLSRESSLKGKLGSLRSALSIYISDNEGGVPGDLQQALVNGNKYLNDIPVGQVPETRLSPGHGSPNRAITAVVDDVTEVAAWAYDSVDGLIFVNCTHPVIRPAGAVWSDR
jgi:prepilin-type N-terminal cleavage/methylation domain-containing protein